MTFGVFSNSLKLTRFPALGGSLVRAGICRSGGILEMSGIGSLAGNCAARVRKKSKDERRTRHFKDRCNTIFFEPRKAQSRKTPKAHVITACNLLLYAGTCLMKRKFGVRAAAAAFLHAAGCGSERNWIVIVYYSLLTDQVACGINRLDRWPHSVFMDVRSIRLHSRR